MLCAAVAAAITSVTLFGTVAILVLPLLVRVLGLGAVGAVVWVGAGVNRNRPPELHLLSARRRRGAASGG